MTTHEFAQFFSGGGPQSPAGPLDEAASKEVAQLVSEIQAIPAPVAATARTAMIFVVMGHLFTNKLFFGAAFFIKRGSFT